MCFLTTLTGRPRGARISETLCPSAAPGGTRGSWTRHPRAGPLAAALTVWGSPPGPRPGLRLSSSSPVSPVSPTPVCSQSGSSSSPCPERTRPPMGALPCAPHSGAPTAPVTREGSTPPEGRPHAQPGTVSLPGTRTFPAGRASTRPRTRPRPVDPGTPAGGSHGARRLRPPVCPARSGLLSQTGRRALSESADTLP